MFIGSVDLISPTCIAGWCFDLEKPSQRLNVEVSYEEKTLIMSIANKFRPDLQKVNHRGDISFNISFDAVRHPERIKAIARDESGKSYIIPVNCTISYKKRGYQTFDDQDGDSDSQKKLECLMINQDYTNLSILDIGCNEGYFCIDAVKRNAKRVVGIDYNKDVIDKARKRTNAVEFINCSWWDIPNEKFDIIYFLSAIHYETQQKKLLNKLANYLNPNGKLILECGVVVTHTRQWYSIQRNDGIFRYPSLPLIKDILSDSYAVTQFSPSAMQSGDPVPRWVFHCYKKKNIVILLNETPGKGKTFLSSKLSINQNIVHISIDDLFHFIKKGDIFKDDTRPLYYKIRNSCDLMCIGTFCENLNSDEEKDLADMILSNLPNEYECILLEGAELNSPQVRNIIINELFKRDIRVWDLTRLG